MGDLWDLSGSRVTSAAAFSEHLLDLYNGGLLTLMVSIGHRTGLFDVMGTLLPATSAEIADNAGLDERYVREWLAAMTTGGLVVHDPRDMTFALPPEHAAHLTRAAGPRNSAVSSQLLGILAAVEGHVVECFRQGGGVPRSEFPRLEAISAEIGWAALDAGLLDSVLASVPGLRRRLQAGIDVADVGCGWGHALNLMAEAFPGSRFVGWDVSDEALAAGRSEAERKGLVNVCFDQRDAAALGVDEGFDFITSFSAVHEQARPDLVLAGIAKAMRAGGTYLCSELHASSNLAENMALPWAPGMYAMSCMRCLTVSLAAGGLGLGAMWGEQSARRMFAEAGLIVLEVKRLQLDPFNNYYIATKEGW
jgi:2-polyprenyl-3-methyl-5-hydroxy-6-metoxy-1,4-benzoquinol methylase